VARFAEASDHFGEEWVPPTGGDVDSGHAIGAGIG
jgi:hypothetical protein